MKIIILSNLFPPNARGGAEVVAKNQADKLLREGNEIIVITLAPHSVVPAKAGIQTDGLKIYELRHRNIFNYLNIGKHSALARFLWHIIDTFNFQLANDIKKIIRKEKPDLVICHNLKGLSLLTPFKIQNLPAGRQCSKFKIHQVMHDVSLYTPSGLIEYGKENIFEHQGFLTKIYRFFTRRLFQYPEKVFFPSRWLMDFYSQNGFFRNQEKILEPNAAGYFDCHCEDPAFNAGDAAISSGSPRPVNRPRDDKNREGLLYVGQLEPHKGIILLLDAFEKLFPGVIMSASEGSRDSFPAFAGTGLPAALQNDTPMLHIVGDGSLFAEIKKRAESNPNIKIYGRIPREKLPEFYSRAKATIFPSLVYENAPMVIAESLSCGTPVIVSRLGGAPELVREGENGATFTPDDIDDLVEKIKRYL